MTKEQNLCRGPEVVGILAITTFFVFFPLAGVVYAGIAYMVGTSLPVWTTILSGIIMFVLAIAIWLTIVGVILRKIGGKG